MERINLNIPAKDRALLRQLAGDRSEAEYCRELLLRALREDRIRALNAALAKMSPQTRERLRLANELLDRMCK